MTIFLLFDILFLFKALNKQERRKNIKDLPRNKLENNPKYIVPIAFDDIFRELFGTDKNIKVTTYLISAILNIPYKELIGHVRIKNPKMNNFKVKEKHAEKDIVVSVDIDNPLRINLEMNKYNIANATIDRNIFYLSDLFIAGLKKKDIYEELVTTIQINFNPRFIDKENEPLVDIYSYRNEYGNILTKKYKSIT